MEKYFLFYLLAFIAEVIGTVSGFGSSLLFVPIASLFFDFKIVLGITAIFHIFSNLSKIMLFRKGVNKEIVLKLGIPAVISVIIGAYLSNKVPQKELELFMSIFLVVLSILLIIYSSSKLAPSNNNLINGGIVSGLLAGLIGTGGAIRGLTITAFQLEKNVFLATSALIDLGVDTSRAIVYTLNGYVKKEFLHLIPILILISIVGSWVGKKFLDHMPQSLFRQIVLGLIIITSIFQTIKYFKS